MKKNIYANLNFADSLSDFQEDVTKLLELKNIEEWSGRIVKEREETIRQAALVLAGQCIAILLHKLSQSESAHQTAINQTLLMVAYRHAKTRLYEEGNINSR